MTPPRLCPNRAAVVGQYVSAAYVNLFLRALVMVSLVSLNTVQIAHGRLLAAVGIGGLISFVWFMNAGEAGRTTLPKVPAALAYAAGAMAGTLLGMWIGGAV